MTESYASTSATRAPDTRTDRLVVPDVLRGVAILAMLIAHAQPFLTAVPGSMRFVGGNISDLASPLFALVMGISAQIVLQRTPRGRRGVMLVQQFARGLVLIALGVWLSTWGTWIAIVLSHLGVVLLIGVPLLFLSTRWLVAVAIALAALSEPLNAWARAALLPVLQSSPLLEVANWLVLGSWYRATNLLPFFLLGALLMRHGFVRDRMLWAMAIIAPLAYLVRPVAERLAGQTETQSGTYADTLHDVGLVFAVYVVVVLLATVRRPRPARVIALVFEPLRAIGAVALSLYLLHVGLIALLLRWGYIPVGGGWPHWLLVVAGSIIAGWLWWRFVGVGPVEWLLGWVTGRPKRRRQPGPPPGTV